MMLLFGRLGFGPLTFGMEPGVVAAGTMPMLVPTTDRELLGLLEKRCRAGKKFAKVFTYHRPPRSIGTAEDIPTLILYLDTGTDLPEPSPIDKLRMTRFAAVVVTKAPEGDAVAGDRADTLADDFGAIFHQDKSFGGRCIANKTWLSDAVHDDAQAPEYFIAWSGVFCYTRRRAS